MYGNDLTKGSVARTMLRFTIPFFVANLLHTLYGIVDMYIVGQFADSTQLSSVSLGAAVMMLFNGLVMGLGTGGTVLVGQVYGSKNQQDQKETLSTIFSVIPLFGFLLMVLAQFFIPALLRVMHTPAEAWDGAVSYLRICTVGLIFTGFFFAIAAGLRGMGDSKGPTVFIACASVFNALGDYVCVRILHWGATGAALATSAGQGLSVAIGYFYLRRNHFPFDFKPRSYRIYKSKLKLLLRIGIPTALQEAMTSISFLVLESIINKMGYIATAAAGVTDRVFSACVMPANSFAAATAAMVAQNTGAKKYHRSRKCLRTGLLIASAITAIFFILMAIIPEKMIGAFTKDREVVSAGVAYLAFYKYDTVLFTLAFCVIGYINGTGHTRYTMIVNLAASFAVRLPLVWLISLRPGTTLYHIGLVLPSASIVQLTVGIIFLLFAKSEREHLRQETELRA